MGRTVRLATHDLARLRLIAQGAHAAESAAPVDVVRWMTAMQAQDLSGALWAIGLRMPQAKETVVIDAFNRGDIVRGWPMRGTLHAILPNDLRDILSLTGERTLRSMRSIDAQLGLTEHTYAQAMELVYDALSGASRLTRTELLSAVRDGGVDTSAQRGGHIIYRAALTGLVVMGPFAGAQQTFVLSESWLPPHTSRDAAEIVSDIATRYIASHGPVTDADFARWIGLPLTTVRAGIAAAGASITPIETDGSPMFVTSESLDQLDGSPVPGARRTYLLPGFDEFMLGYSDRSFAVPVEYLPRIVPGNNGVFRATVVIGGKVAGLWAQTKKSREVSIDVTPFSPLTTSAMRGISLAATRYGRFIGRDAPVRFLDA